MFRFEGRLEEIVMCFAGFMVTHLVMITAKAIVGSFVMTLLYSFLSISLGHAMMIVILLTFLCVQSNPS